VIRFAALGSGSRGNALVVESGTTRVLLDCGFGPRELERRLGRLGLASGDINAVVVTHEHSDHIGGVKRCAQKFGWPVHLTHGSFVAGMAADTGVAVNLIDGRERFSIGDLELFPFPVPHDAREPVQYAFSDGAVKLGVVTDLGESTPHVVGMLNGCAALVLECNHDAALLAASRYPEFLKQRIAGRFGHLANDTAAALLCQLDSGNLRHLIAAHLSEKNNTPDLARNALAQAMGCAADWVGISGQEDGFGWRSIG
jgi:phosphoribosyl 1,2-cyclic phosphodiesterase